MLRTVARFRYLTTDQLHGFCFTDHATPAGGARICRRVLQRLSDHRVLEHLDRRIGGVRAGSQSYVWRVGPIGDRLLRSDDQLARDRRHEPSLRFLDHVLAVADCALRLTTAAAAQAFNLVSLQTEPDNWHRYIGPHGSRDVVKPDLYAVTASSEFEDHWFLEIDRATESLPTVVRQCERYEAFRRTGRLQAEIEVFPRVVWLVPDERRAERLRGAIAASRRLDQSLYLVALQQDATGVITAEAAS